METILQKKLSIDKTKWTPVKFGEVVFEPKESSKDPVADGIKHVVGLEHIESENIHLRKSQTLEESTTFTKKFAIGDVLFGRRRAYLRKASQASFNGICSGDITVFRAKENLMPELLPFVVNNEKFFDYAIKHSAGGLSPRVKFKDLANYEFLLPPKDQQAQLAKLLWAMDEVIEGDSMLLIKLESTKDSLVNNFFNNTDNFEKHIPLNELLNSFQNGFAFSSKGYQEKGCPIVTMANISLSGRFEIKKQNHWEYNNSLERYLIHKGDILIAMTDVTPDKNLVGRMAIVNKDGPFLLNQRVGLLKPNSKKLTTKYLQLYSNSNKFRWFSISHSTLGVQSNLGTEDIKKAKIPYVNIEKQNVLAMKAEGIEQNIENTESKISSSKSLQKSLINQIF